MAGGDSTNNSSPEKVESHNQPQSDSTAAAHRLIDDTISKPPESKTASSPAAAPAEKTSATPPRDTTMDQFPATVIAGAPEKPGSAPGSAATAGDGITPAPKDQPAPAQPGATPTDLTLVGDDGKPIPKELIPSAPFTATSDGTPLTAAQIKDEATKVDGMFKKYLTDTTPQDQAKDFVPLQQEITSVAAHGTASVTKVMNQVDSDLKNDDDVHPVPWMSNMREYDAKINVPGLHEDLDASIGVTIGAKDVTVAASDGDAGPNYSNYFNASITVAGNAATSKETGKILPDQQQDSGGYSGGNDSGPNASPSSSSDNGVHPVNIQNLDGSISPGYSEPGGAYYEPETGTYIPPGQTYE